jgi:predicted AAA+ superfamily ATPase
VVGGMPEVVESWITEHDIRKVDELQRKILGDYSEMIIRCCGRLSERILSVWSSIPTFLSRPNHKFIFRDLKKDGRANDFELSVQWLSDAHLIHRVNQLDRHVFPSAIVDDPGLYKLYMCDIGLLRVMSGQPVDVMLSDSGDYMPYKDGMYENLVVCELDSSDIDGLYYWRDRRYEADLVVRVGDRSIPLDVCSGNVCDNESLNAYAKISGESRSAVISDRPFTDGDRKIIPFYRVGEVDYRSMIDDGGKFIMDISEDMWVSDRNSFLLRIPFDKHRMGRSPRCTVVDENADHMPIAIGVLYNGDVVLKSNTVSRGRVIIEESESEMVL